jgi:hypothetical protein
VSRRTPAIVVPLSASWRKLGVRRVTPWHWQAKVYGETLEIWPGAQKWRYRRETETGALTELMAAIKSARAIEAADLAGRGP